MRYYINNSQTFYLMYSCFYMNYKLQLTYFLNYRVEPATTSTSSTVVTMATLKKVRECIK